MNINNDRDKYMTEAMGGRKVSCCVVEGDADIDETCVLQATNHYTADDCIYGHRQDKPEDCDQWQERLIIGASDFSTWEKFGKLWEWAQGQEWFDLFMCDTYYLNYNTPLEAAMDNDGYLHADYINPDRFANAVYAFLKGREA